MSETLYLFVTSERPDQYLNSMVHCLLYRGVRRVVFTHIKGLDIRSRDKANERSICDIALRNVLVLLDSLAVSGEYRHFVGLDAGTRIALESLYPQEEMDSLKEFYRRCMDIEIDIAMLQINYRNLRSELARICNDDPGSVLDVTSIKKLYMGDIFAISIIEDIHHLYTFDFRSKEDYDHPWIMLIHNLQPDDTAARLYKYVNIIDTQIFQECRASMTHD